MLAYDKMRKKQNIYSTKNIVCNMQRRHVALGNNPPTPIPPPLLLNISQSSLKTPHPDDPRPHPHISAPTHTQNITKHDYVTKPVSLENGEAL